MVSIIMATYNGERFVNKQIKSIIESSYKNFNLLISDDGSKDNTLDIVNKYVENYPEKVNLIQNEKNLGVTANFLNALCRTTSDYIMFCDQDDVWKPDKIKVTLNRMRRMESIYGKDIPLAVFTDVEVTDKNLNVINPSFYKAGRLNPQKRDLCHMLMENKMMGCTVMVNCALRKIIQSKALPEHARYHDWWIGIIAASMGRISFLNKATLLYRQHEENVVGNMSFASYVKNRVTSIRKQKDALNAVMRQADEFYHLYKDVLPLGKMEDIIRFANLNKMGFLRRRMTLLKYGYLKTGLIRNMGVLLIL